MDIQKEKKALDASEFNRFDLDIKDFATTNEFYRLLGWLEAKSQAVPEGFVLMPKVITDEWMEVVVDQEVSKYSKEYEGLPFSVKDDELPDLRESYRLPIRNAHKRLMRVIEAQEKSHECD